jgi:aerotaxis receptor
MQATEVIEGISNGAQQQLLGISQINESVAQMDTITQQNAALVEQIAAAAQQLALKAQAVTEAVRVFRLGDEGPAEVPDAVALRREARQSAPQPAPRRPAAASKAAEAAETAPA